MLYQACYTLCVFVFTSFIIPSRKIRMQAFSCEYKLKELFLQNGCPSYYLALSWKTTLIMKVSIKIAKAFKQHTLKCFYPKSFSHTASFFTCFATFLTCSSVNGCPHDFTKSNCEMPYLSAKKHFKKENPLRRGWGASTQCRGSRSFQNRGLVSLCKQRVTFLISQE